MKEKLRKLFLSILALSIIVPQFLIPLTYVRAKTLGDLENELKKKQEELEKNKQEKQLTEKEIADTKLGIENTNKEITQISNQMVVISDEIEQLNQDIENKEEEIKRIVNFLQVANGESAYMEYIFGAQDFTDFIYRTAISEQMSEYNEKLIDQFNDMIEKNKQKQKELERKQRELEQKQKDLKVQLDKLGSKKTSLYDIGMDIEESLKVQAEIIKMYKDKSCKSNENIETCGTTTLSPDTKFWRPVQYGIVTSTFGYRTYWLNGREVSDFHTGVDLSGSGSGSPIYATAKGTVAAIAERTNCGGNMVYIHHYVNGKYYTSLYMHLRTINVKKGEAVTKDTVIGTMGGDASTWWDDCSTGAHVHFTLLNGLVGKDFYPFDNGFYSRLLNPQNYVNMPSNKWMTDRLTKY